jgi:hypothetical protein
VLFKQWQHLTTIEEPVISPWLHFQELMDPDSKGSKVWFSTEEEYAQESYWHKVCPVDFAQTARLAWGDGDAETARGLISEHVLVVKLDDLKADAEGIMDIVTAFLDLQPFEWSSMRGRINNVVNKRHSYCCMHEYAKSYLTHVVYKPCLDRMDAYFESGYTDQWRAASIPWDPAFANEKRPEADVDTPSLPHGRLALRSGSSNDEEQAEWEAFTVLYVLAVVCALLALGRYTRVIDRFKTASTKL